jgi:hypothetical protein
MSGLDIHYDLGERRPLLGRRMPDLDLVTANGPLRVFTLLHDARPVRSTSVRPGASTSLHGQIGFSWSTPKAWVRGCFPYFGAVTAPTAVVIRPDGYVTWVGDRTQLGLPDALRTWFGPPTTA